MIDFYEVIKASEGIAVADEFAALWGRKFSGDISIYTGTLPATLQTVAGFLESFKIYGNTEQIGTPTPENPIVPSGCGVRTENLLPFDDKNFVISTGGSNLIVECKNGSLNMKGTTTEIITTNENWKNNFTFELKAGTYYCNSPSPLVGSFGRYIKKYDNNSNILGAKNYTFTITENTKCYLAFYIHNRVIDSEIKLMLNLGSTPLPYEPYGYKLPILSNDTTTDIYIGNTALAKDEYVDSETGKIYRYVDGTLTPTDPPAPLPQIPTAAGKTTIDYGSTVIPCPEGLDGIFEYGNIDGLTWKNSVSGENDITFDTAITDTGAEYVLPAGASGQYTSKSGEYRTAFTWYCIAKCPTTCQSAGQYMVSNWNNQGVEISSGWANYTSAGTNHLVRSINNQDFNSAEAVTSYALIAVSGDVNGMASVYVNGVKMTDSWNFNPVSSSGAATVFLGKRASGQLSGTDIDYKFLAFGTTKQTDSEIAANSQYLMTKYLGVGRPEKVELKYRK